MACLSGIHCPVQDKMKPDITFKNRICTKQRIFSYRLSLVTYVPADSNKRANFSSTTTLLLHFYTTDCHHTPHTVFLLRLHASPHPIPDTSQLGLPSDWAKNGHTTAPGHNHTQDVIGGWRGGSVVRSTSYPYRGQEFGFQKLKTVCDSSSIGI